MFNLAITTSGASLSTTLPSTISPSRLLQASTFLTAGDTQYVLQSKSVQIGPVFTLSLYMLFAGHVRPQNEEEIRDTTWKEVMHKARIKLLRVPVEELYNMPKEQMRAEFRDEYAYQIVIIEDLDDDRVHEEEGESYQGVEKAGMKEIIPVHEISKIFYADTGKLLNIGSDEDNSPVLLLKRDLNAIPPRKMMQRFEELPEINHQLGLPSAVDPEWLAFEVYTEPEDSDNESNDLQVLTPGTPTIKTSLSLLETILRLLSLQQFQQMSHLSISDEFLNFFLSEAGTTGAANGDEVNRRRLRFEARQRLGFDPYDESPIKRRGEEYQIQNLPPLPGSPQTPVGGKIKRYISKSPLGKTSPGDEAVVLSDDSKFEEMTLRDKDGLAFS
jgi:hypothetical protein